MKDSTKIEQDMFVRKDCDPSVWWKRRNCSAIMKTEKECLCFQEVGAVCDFNLQGIFSLSQAIILSEVTHNLMIYVSICLSNLTWFQNLSKMELLSCLR